MRSIDLLVILLCLVATAVIGLRSSVRPLGVAVTLLVGGAMSLTHSAQGAG